MTYISTKKLKIGYKKALGASINLNLKKGEILQIKGPNGSGKSTLLKTLMKEMAPLSGAIHWNLDSKEISYLPQAGENMNNFNFTLGEILQIYNVPSSIQSYLRKDLEDRLWINASGGEKQLTLILSRITELTKVLILDEPLNHLDNSSRDLIEDLIKKIMQKNNKISLMIVSHLEIKLDKRELLLC